MACGARAHHFTQPRLSPSQGHVFAAVAIGDVYFWGKGVAIDCPRAMAAYKIAAEAGDAVSQYQVGIMYYMGRGVAVDYQQARPWLEKAAAQDYPKAVSELGVLYHTGRGVISSYRRARELYKRAIELGDSLAAVKSMQNLTKSIQNVSSLYLPPLSSSPYRESSPISLAPFPPSHAQVASLMDKRVEIHGTSRADMRGKRGGASNSHGDEDDSK